MKPIPTSPIQSSYFVQDLSSVVCFDKEILSFLTEPPVRRITPHPSLPLIWNTNSRMKYRWDPTPLLCSRASFDPISNSALSTYSPPLLPRILMKEDRNTNWFSYGSVPASGPPLFGSDPIQESYAFSFKRFRPIRNKQQGDPNSNSAALSRFWPRVSCIQRPTPSS